MVRLTKIQLDILEEKLALQVCCSAENPCGQVPGLTEKEMTWLSQQLRDHTKLTLGARKQVLEKKLRDLSEGQLDELEDASNRANGMPG